jgi:hypothetical protein
MTMSAERKSGNAAVSSACALQMVRAVCIQGAGGHRLRRRRQVRMQHSAPSTAESSGMQRERKAYTSSSHLGHADAVRMI